MKIDAEVEGVVMEAENKNCLQPIIVNFLNGQLKDEETSNMKSGLFLDPKSGKTVLALSNGKVVYKGYRPNMETETMSTVLAIHNKRTGKVRLIQAERWDVKPVLNRSLDSDQSSKTDRTSILNKQFGSKKIKRRTEQREKLNHTSQDVSEFLAETVSNIEIKKVDDSEDESTTISILPPCNKEADKVEDIYNINDIIPKSIIETLYHVGLDTVEKTIETKSEFFRRTFEGLKDKQNANKRLAVLLFIEATMKWLKAPIKNSKKHDKEICPYSTIVKDYVIERYSVINAGGRLRPNTMRDKAIIECMILALALSNYSLDLELFSTQITARMSMKKLTDFSRVIYAVPSKEDKKSIVLKLPLPSEISFSKKRGRK